MATSCLPGMRFQGGLTVDADLVCLSVVVNKSEASILGFGGDTEGLSTQGLEASGDTCLSALLGHHRIGSSVYVTRSSTF